MIFISVLVVLRTFLSSVSDCSVSGILWPKFVSVITDENIFEIELIWTIQPLLLIFCLFSLVGIWPFGVPWTKTIYFLYRMTFGHIHRTKQIYRIQNSVSGLVVLKIHNDEFSKLIGVVSKRPLVRALRGKSFLGCGQPRRFARENTSSVISIGNNANLRSIHVGAKQGVMKKLRFDTFIWWRH